MSQKRNFTIERKTNETDISLSFNIDGTGKSTINTGIGFFNHMLDLFVKHGLFDLNLTVNGDLDVDFHHTVEDVGICLGQAFSHCIGDSKGIQRYSSALVPMDEALCQCAIDISKRPHLSFIHTFSKEKVGQFDSELVDEFFQAFVNNAKIALHLTLLAGNNTHHKIEACFKAFGICLDQATMINPRQTGIPSTKGIL